MSPAREQTVYPCPFSKNYGIARQQAWQLLKIFYLYRLVLSSLFVIFFFSPYGSDLFGTNDQLLYIVSSSLYLLVTVLSLPFIFWRVLKYTVQAQLLVFSDIVFITLLMHACGGVSSGLGVLMAISIAAAGLLIGGRCALLFAALASLAVLAEQLYGIRVSRLQYSTFTNAGLLGAAYFTIAFLSHIMAQRTEQSYLLAKERQQTISRLEELNRYIIQHLQSGIIILDHRLQVLLSNEAAIRLLHLPRAPRQVTDISTGLLDAFEAWRADEVIDTRALPLQDESEVQLRFSSLEMQDEQLYMILIEDGALYNQRLQHLKLASLGRLTASIAHEVRNPLGAISHAGQLLSEATELFPQNKRLTEIIQHHCFRVNNIIENILNLSRRTPSRKIRVNLNAWLPDFVDSFRAEQNYAINPIFLAFAEDTMHAWIDPGHLRQILTNLCVNATTYGCRHQDDHIRIEVTRLHNQPCVRVIDNGTGISKETCAHLFEPFFTTSKQGTGLGLYISRELAELNQAKLNYDLYHDKTSFTLCLTDAELSVVDL